MSEKKWIALVLFIVTTAPLHWLGIRWLSDRHAFCRDGTVDLVPREARSASCEYPEQTLALEDERGGKLGICRCRR